MASEGSSTRVIYDISNITSSTKLNVGDIINIPYSGAAKNITLPAGKFKLQCWGAQGGTYSTYTGGAGGYSVGTLTLAEDTILYVYVGGQPTSSSSTSAAIAGGFNGGGQARPHSYSGTSSTCQAGGGGTDFRIKQDSLYARVIVAGGGGGSASDVSLTTKYGGGTSGGSSISGYGGTQTSAGTSGSFGQGANGYISGYNYKYASGGAGGGWYGGGAIQQHSDSTNYRSYNGGGSGYVYTSSTASNYPSGCLLNSSYYLTDASTIAGNTSFPSTSGANETGHTGNGYARITVVEIAPTFSLPVRVDDEWKLATSGAVNVNGAWKNIAQMFSKVDGNWVECMGGEPPIEGTWRFNSTIDSNTLPMTACKFKDANGAIYYGIGTNSGDFPVFYTNMVGGKELLIIENGEWIDEAYRTITFIEPVSASTYKDFATWFKANAIKLVSISGTWVFNVNPTSILDHEFYDSDGVFISNGTTYRGMTYDSGDSDLAYIRQDASPWDVYDYTYHTWENGEIYRTITFIDTQMVPKDFYQWFTANAEPLPAKGKTLNEYTWSEISLISLADKATEYGFKVGDMKKVHLSGTAGDVTWDNDYWVYIIGINHNEAKEGKGVAFQGFKTAQTGGVDVALVGSNYGSTGTTGFVMNQSGTNTGGWNGSYAYKTQCPQIKACFPSDLQAVIRTTTLYTDNTGNSSTSASNVTVNENQVYYLAECEVFGVSDVANTGESTQQVQYDYYKTGNSEVKYRSDSTSTAVYWWLRSPYSSARTSFCSAYRMGYARIDSANASYGVSPCFKV